MSGGEHAVGAREEVRHRGFAYCMWYKRTYRIYDKKTAYLQWHELEKLRFKTEQLVD